jgi:hypothetical protein
VETTTIRRRQAVALVDPVAPQDQEGAKLVQVDRRVALAEPAVQRAPMLVGKVAARAPPMRER